MCIGRRVDMKPHAWSHACTSVSSSGHVVVVINGVITHGEQISNMNFMNKFPRSIKDSLVLGSAWKQFYSDNLEKFPSEASVTNVNIFSGKLSVGEMMNSTSLGLCLNVSLLTWSQTRWTTRGNVKSEVASDFCGKSTQTHLFNLPYPFEKMEDCLSLCPRMGAGGRVPEMRSLAKVQELSKNFLEWSRSQGNNEELVGPFILGVGDNFLDFYTTAIMPIDMWVPGQPNALYLFQCKLNYLTKIYIFVIGLISV